MKAPGESFEISCLFLSFLHYLLKKCVYVSCNLKTSLKIHKKNKNHFKKITVSRQFSIREIGNFDTDQLRDMGRIQWWVPCVLTMACRPSLPAAIDADFTGVNIAFSNDVHACMNEKSPCICWDFVRVFFFFFIYFVCLVVCWSATWVPRVFSYRCIHTCMYIFGHNKLIVRFSLPTASILLPLPRFFLLALFGKYEYCSDVPVFYQKSYGLPIGKFRST